MLTEAEWVAALDAAPGDATLRLVYADWLDERGGCGDGWRALGELAAAPEWRKASGHWFWWRMSDFTMKVKANDPAVLPDDWFDLLKLARAAKWDHYAPTRHAAESAAADAFLRLPAARRAELLGVPV